MRVRSARMKDLSFTWEIVFLFHDGILESTFSFLTDYAHQFNYQLNPTELNQFARHILFVFFIEKFLHERGADGCSINQMIGLEDILTLKCGATTWARRMTNDNNEFLVCLFVDSKNLREKFIFFSFHEAFDGIDSLSVDCVIDLEILPLEIDGNFAWNILQIDP